MTREWERRSKDGKRFFHAGIGTADAVGTPHPGHDIPLQEGARLLFAKGVDRWWRFMKIALLLRVITGGLRKKRKTRRIGKKK